MALGILLRDEISTRNCTHCIPNTSDENVHCDEGHPLLDLDDQPYSYEEVIESDELLWPCRDCPDFESHF